MKRKCGKEKYTHFCTSEERNVTVWFKTGIWKLRGTERGLRKDSPYVRRRKMLYIYY
jgi:hypothetical protein